MITVRIVRLPNSAMPEEFDALAAEPEVDLAFVDSPAELGVPDMVVLPGSEATIPDLAHMRETGMDAAVRRAAEAGSLLFGICGGFQMLGSELHDPEGLEGGSPKATGLGVFDLITRFTRENIDEPVRATSAGGGFLPEGGAVSGFELHGGQSILRGEGAVPLFNEPAGGDASCPLGIATRDYAAIGTYLHGVLADPLFRRSILDHLQSRKSGASG
jgi:adenosylcobyric acid synthase